MVLGVIAAALLLQGKNNVWPSWSPSSDRIAFTSSVSDLWVMNRDGSGARELTSDLIVHTPPVWSPDGSALAFTAGALASLFVAAVDGSSTRSLRVGVYPAWSPNGSQLAYSFNHEIRVISRDGSGDRLVVKTDADPGQVAWSPDGTRLAYVDGSTLRTVALDGADARTLVAPQPVGSRNPTDPQWSPDGTRISFVEAGPFTAPQPQDVWVVAPDGSGLTRLASFAYLDGPTRWTGRDILVTGAKTRDGHVDAYRIPSVGGTPVDVTADRRWDENAVLAPDGRSLAYDVRYGVGYGKADVWVTDLATNVRRNLTGTATGVTLPARLVRKPVIRGISTRLDGRVLRVTVHVQDAQHDDVSGQLVRVTTSTPGVTLLPQPRRLTDIHGFTEVDFRVPAGHSIVSLVVKAGSATRLAVARL